VTIRQIILSGLFAAAAFAACNVWRNFDECPAGATCVNDAGAVDVTQTDIGSDRETTVGCEELPWNTPKPAPGLEKQPIISVRLDATETSMFVAYGNPPNGTTIYAVARDTPEAAFRLLGPVPSINAKGASQFAPSVTDDGLLMFFESARTLLPIDDAGTYRDERARVWSASRNSKLVDFDTPKVQSLFQGDNGAEASPYLHPSKRSVYFASNGRDGGVGNLDLWVALLDVSGNVTQVKNLRSVNSDTEENAPVVSLDERWLYFNHRGDPGLGFQNDIFVSKRNAVSDDFAMPTREDTLSSDYDDYPGWVSPDHCRFYFTSQRPLGNGDGGNADYHVWIAERAR
jgi:hypothetical protein